MYVITIKLHDGTEIISYRETLEAAEKYERLCRKNGVSISPRWFNPSNIAEVTIYDEADTAPKLEADTKSASKPARGRPHKTPVRSSDK